MGSDVVPQTMGAHVVIVAPAGPMLSSLMNCTKGQKMKIGSIGFYHGDIVRVLQIGQSALIVEILDNPRIDPFPIVPVDFGLFWV